MVPSSEEVMVLSGGTLGNLDAASSEKLMGEIMRKMAVVGGQCRENSLLSFLEKFVKITGGKGANDTSKTDKVHSPHGKEHKAAKSPIRSPAQVAKFPNNSRIHRLRGFSKCENHFSLCPCHLGDSYTELPLPLNNLYRAEFPLFFYRNLPAAELELCRNQ